MHLAVTDTICTSYLASTPEGAEVIALDPPAVERLSELHIPTLVLVGDRDLPQKLALAHELTTQITGAQ